MRENRVIAGIAHDRRSRSLNAAMNKTTHIEIIAETSKRLRGFSLANMICSPWLEGSFIAEFRRLDGVVPDRVQRDHVHVVLEFL